MQRLDCTDLLRRGPVLSRKGRALGFNQDPGFNQFERARLDRGSTLTGSGPAASVPSTA